MSTNYQNNLVKRTLLKLSKSQRFKHDLLMYLTKEKPHLLRNPIKYKRLKDCSNTVVFRKDLETGEKTLMNANFCKYDRICKACATKRAIGMIKRFEEGIKTNNLYGKHWYYIVLTIKHKSEDSLEDLLAKLMQFKGMIARKYRNSKRSNQKNKSFFHRFDGMAISIEISHKGKHGWHPHINILACSDEEIEIDPNKHFRGAVNEELKAEWLKITGDSYVHNIRKIQVKGNSFTRSGIGEVFKYAIKFSDLTIAQLAEVMDLQAKHRYRFFSSYGLFRGRSTDHGKKEKSDPVYWRDGVFLFDDSLNLDGGLMYEHIFSVG